ncbi:MAG: N-acetylmuramoyl-L-alanine amidase [Saonia sp.]
MKHYCFYVLIWIFNLTFFQVLGQERTRKSMVIIDPGHGGTDSGAIGINGLKEKEVVLRIAREVVRLNRELFNDTLEIYLTRYSDTLISLQDRSNLARALNTDAFVSIHCNQAARKAARGIEVYVNPSETDVANLAKLFVLGLNEKLGFRNRGVKYGNFQVLRETTQCPSVLLELGFLSNWEEAEHNKNANAISGYALLIVKTLIKFLNYD